MSENMKSEPTGDAVGLPVEREVRSRLTPWFPHTTKPARPGFYRWQDWTMNCNCCWYVAHWNGRGWHTDLFERGRFNTLLFDSQVKRWRGLAKRPNVRGNVGPTAAQEHADEQP